VAFSVKLFEGQSSPCASTAEKRKLQWLQVPSAYFKAAHGDEFIQKSTLQIQGRTTQFRLSRINSSAVLLAALMLPDSS